VIAAAGLLLLPTPLPLPRRLAGPDAETAGPGR
jgi:hypothetical protein